MPTNTYTPIGSVTLATATSEVTFTVPTGYRDLVLVGQVGSAQGSTDYIVAFLNGDRTAGNYSDVWMRGYSSGTQSATGNTSLFDTGMAIDGTGLNTNFIMQIMDYSATDKHKTVLIRLNDQAGTVWAVASRWASTSAVTSVTFDLTGGNFRSGTILSMYGIVA